MKVLNIGFGNMVSQNRVIAILSPDAAPVKRIIKNNKDSGQLIDATCGKRTQAVIIMDSGHVVLSGLKSDLLENRVKKGHTEEVEEM